MFIFKSKVSYTLRACLIMLAMVSAGPLYAGTQVFVSFSMPEQLMEETLAESARLNIPANLNGLVNDSMPETIAKIAALTERVPDLALQIDPTAFERYGIKQVPALVVEAGDCFDVLYGTLTLTEGLNRIARSGACARKAGLVGAR
jgi:conjugal transfer pilus assembly protein TrbC